MTKQEKSEYNRKWYMANRESELEKSRIYSRENRHIIKRVSANLAARNWQMWFSLFQLSSNTNIYEKAVFTVGGLNGKLIIRSENYATRNG